MTRIAITGATGFIGAHVLKRALSDGHEVRALVRAPARIHRANNLHVVRWKAEEETDPETLRGIEVVCHTASFIPSDMKDLSPKSAEECFEINVVGTVRLLQACVQAGVRRLVNFSSANAYAPGHARPNESWPVYPSARAPLYLASKIAQEVMAEHWRLSRRIEAATLRPGSVYGPGQTSGFIPKFIRRLLRKQDVVLENGGSFGADFVHVDDVAAIAVAAMNRQHQGIFNVGSGRHLTVRQIADVLVRELGARPEQVVINPCGESAEAGFPALDIARAVAAFGYRPRPFEEGIRGQIRQMSEQDDG
jgi:UDP-glucose 4-epimerase